MGEYIEREMALEAIDEYFHTTNPDGDEQIGVLKSRKIIRTLPSADVAQIQEWIPVTERLPNESEYVMVFDGKCQIAKIERGISKKERDLMKNGEINDPVEIEWNMSDGFFLLKRSELYMACDEWWNNRVPYCWHVYGGMGKLFGQNVTHWMPMPQPPKGE